MLAGEVDLAVHSLKDVPDGAARRPGAVRDPRARRPARRAPVRGAAARRAARRGRASAPRACAGRRCCARCGPTSCSPTCAATSTRASGGCARAASTRSCSRWPGSRRLGRADEVTEALEPAAVRARAGAGGDRPRVPRRRRRRVREAVAPLDHAPTARAVAAERAFLAALGGGCNVPLGAHAFAAGGELRARRLRGGGRRLGPAAGGAARRGTRPGARPRAGRGPARRGAPAALLGPLTAMGTLAGRRIVVTRRPGQASTLVRAARGARGDGPRGARHRDRRRRADLGAARRGARRARALRLGGLHERQRRGGGARPRSTVLGLDPRLGAPRARGVAVASGPATTAALRAAFPADRVALEPAADFRAAGLVEAFAGRGSAAGARPGARRRAGPARSSRRACGSWGRRSTWCAAYADGRAARACASAVRRPAWPRASTWPLFASPSAVEAFAVAAGDGPSGLPAAVIGPTTAGRRPRRRPGRPGGGLGPRPPRGWSRPRSASRPRKRAARP